MEILQELRHETGWILFSQCAKEVETTTNKNPQTKPTKQYRTTKTQTHFQSKMIWKLKKIKNLSAYNCDLEVIMVKIRV